MPDFSTAERRERGGATGLTAKSQFVEKQQTFLSVLFKHPSEGKNRWPCGLAFCFALETQALLTA